MSSEQPPPRPSPNKLRGLLVGFIALLLLVIVAFGVWKLFKKTTNMVTQDLVAAAHANARGVGLMEQFQFDKAAHEFEEAAKLAPEWTPAKINLGIALLNSAGQGGAANDVKLDQALELFKDVLKQYPNNPYAHYCSGIIYFHLGQTQLALPHFVEVTRIDPNDAHGWYFRGMCQKNHSESPEALEYFEKALKLNPYLNPCRYSIAQHALLLKDPARKETLLKDFEVFKAAEASDRAEIKYTEMGRYAEVIGKSPAPSPDLGPMPLFEPAKGLAITLAPGTTWATADKLDELRRAIRSRFGGSIILLDYNRDGKPDILLLSAVVRNGQVGDLLLRNEGGFKFTDITQEAGLANHPGNLGGAVGDFDNDGFPDLALAGAAGVKLFRNNGGKGFEDKTAAAGFDREPGVYLTATWVDLEQDGDLDLLAAKYAETPELAIKQLKGEKVDGKGRLVTFVNIGVAPSIKPGGEQKPLSVAFRSVTEPKVLATEGPITGIIASDLDGDYDIDLVLLMDGQPPVTALNDRLFRFHRGENLPLAAGNFNGGLVLDANGDEQPDLVLIDPSTPPSILLSKRNEAGDIAAPRFALGVTDSPPLRSAYWVDLDLDGRTDLVGLSHDHKAVFLQGDGYGKFSRKQMPFGPEADAITDLIAVAPVDFDGDLNPDLLCWSEAGGIRIFRSLGNGNKAISLTLTGIRDPGKGHPLRTNADAVGSWVQVLVGPLRTSAEVTTLSAGLGQSRLPIVIGVGKSELVDVVRVRWPDAIPQAELNKPIGPVTITEYSRKIDSCPTIFLWDGERFVFHADCLGAGSMGELEADGSTRPPRPEESVKIEPGKFVPKDGKYILKIGEPMDEMMYLDRLRLDVIDHPKGIVIFPDERFATVDPQPTQERLFFRNSERIFPVKAIDHRGKDVTATLREWDGKAADDFATRSWLGFAEDHWIELDFAGRLKPPVMGQKTYLVLAGWTDYPYPESIFAANQAGVPTVWPVLEQKQKDGTWRKLGEIGLPAGLPRMMTCDVTGWIDANGGPVRIRTNLQIYWDQVFLAPQATGVESLVRELPVSRASLEHRGFTQEISPGGKAPISYDYDRLEPVVYTKWRGKLTRTGDVTELLARDDDHFVICGPGDEITAEFDATKLLPLPAGWERSFVLRTWGYCKDTALATATNGQVGPLPHRAMSKYPYDPAKEPLPAHIVEYDRIWNTRPAGGR
jgi:Flp pilus assembly protein TadD